MQKVSWIRHTAAQILQADLTRPLANIDQLVDNGIITIDEANRMEALEIQFLGFDPLRIDGNTVMLECTHSDRKVCRRIIVYSDGSVRSFHE